MGSRVARIGLDKGGATGKARRAHAIGEEACGRRPVGEGVWRWVRVKTRRRRRWVRVRVGGERGREKIGSQVCWPNRCR